MKSSINKQEELRFGNDYHIYNRAVGNDKLFVDEADYYFFLKKLKRFILPIAKILSYCLLPNHFHLLVKIKEIEEIENRPNLNILQNNEPEKLIVKQFSNFFNSYSKSFNKAHSRKGKLVLSPFKRIEVQDEDYLIYLIAYIHRNPIHHGLADDYSQWKFSSYNTFLSDKNTEVEREYVLKFFDSLEDFKDFHKSNKTKKGLKELLFE